MKKKLIALLCALSMLLTSVVAIAEDADVSPETELEVTEQISDEEQEALDESEDVAEEIPEEEEEILDEEILDEEVPEEEEILDEEIEDEIVEDEIVEDEIVEDEITEEAEEEQEDAFVSMNAPIMLMSALETVDLVEDAQAARDDLFETLKTYKGLDGGILDPELYGAYETAYRAGQIAFWNDEKTAEELTALAADIVATYDAAKNALVAREKILSGNVKTDADKAHYPDMSSDTLPNLTGTGDFSSTNMDSPTDPSAIIERLLSGVAATPIDNSPNICWGKWGWRGARNIDLNLGEEAYITGADFWENAGAGAGTNYCSDKVAVYTSDDGIEWTLQKEVTVDQSDTPNSLKGTRVDFDAPVKCRYVRVSVIDNAGYQVKFNEVVLRGYRTSQVATAPFVIDDIDYKTIGSGGKRIISLDGLGSRDFVQVKGNVKNTTSEEKTVYVITAAYKDGDMLEMRCSPETVAAYSSEEFVYTMQNLGEETGVELHTFVWDSFGTAKALSAITTFGMGKHEMADVDTEGAGAEFDIDREKLTVWGSASGSGALNDVTLIVLKAGITADDIAEMTAVGDIRNAVVYLEQTTPKSGKYAFESFPADTSAVYGNNNVYVTRQNGDQMFYRMLYLDNTKENAIIDAFQGGTSETMRSVIDANEVLIRGVKAVDEIIAKYDEDTVLNSVAGMILDTEYDTAEELLAEILAAVALTDLNNVATKAEAIESIDTYCEEFGIADNGIYTKLYSGEAYADFKNEVSNKFVGQGYSSIKDFIAEFCEEIVVDMLNDATNYTDVAKVLFADTEYGESIGFDMEEYEDLAPSKQIRVQKLVMKHGNFTDMDDVIDAFNAAVANPGSDKTYGSSGGGGGGGFSGSPSLGTSIPLSGVTANDMSAFKDLSSAEWARESILALHKKGIVSGITSSEFAPNDDVTREQFTKMLIAAFDLLDSDAECDFDDVDKDAWYYEAIASAVKNGIVYGISENSFGVGSKITREDMAVLAYRVLVAKGNRVIYDKSQISDFTDDAEISEYAREAVYAMRGNSVMLGRGNNEFQPKAQATRAEAAKIIYSIMVK